MHIIKKIISAFLVFMMLPSFSGAASSEDIPEISAESAILVHERGKVIFSRKSDKKALIASTTKLMTAILLIENCDADEEVIIKDEYCLPEGSSMYLKPGEKYTVSELLKGLLLVSGNDAAAALASHCSGSCEKFAELMNSKAGKLGMNSSHFSNPHGLDAEGHYSTAADLAELMLYCMKNPVFRELTSLNTAVIGDKTLINHNRLLRLYPDCTGGKTGYTEAAGRCLVSSAERDGCMYVCVTLNDPDDWNDHIKLYNFAFSRFRERNLAEGISFSVPLISGEEDKAEIIGEECELLLPADAVLSVRAELPFFEFAPVAAGETAGRAEVFYNGEKLAELRLFYKKSCRALK